MKKISTFLRSMTFGVILLGLIILFSVAGSVIPQNNEVMYYVRSYPSYYQVILTLGLNRIFTSWYFVVTVILLCINLTLCSIVRFRRINEEDLVDTALQGKETVELDPESLDKVRLELVRMRCHTRQTGDRTVYYKNGFGRYGTFITHLGILFTVVFFALGMSLPKITDQTCMPKESLVLEDGTEIYVDTFSITDSTGRLDYKSVVNIILPNEKESGLTEVSVNHPASAGQYKVYQQTYGTIGRITVRDKKNHQDTFNIESQDFLSSDGKTGILIDNLYPGFTETEEGMQLITSTSGRYENPVYVFVVINETGQEAMLAFPGDSIDVGDYTYYFEDPVEYPGLRIKKSPAYINLFLLIAVLVLVFGLAVTFLWIPVVVLVTPAGYRICSQKAEGLELRLKSVLKKEKE